MNTAKLLANTSLAAGVVFTATAEYSLARRLGAMEPVAVMLPVAIDAYAIAALKRFRPFDIALSLLLMGAAQVAAHLLDSHVMPVNGWLVVVVSLLVPTAIWRTHALARDEVQAPADPQQERAADELPVVEVERVPERHPAIEAAVPAAPEAVPAGVRLLPIVARPEAPRHEIRDEIPAVVSAAEYARTRPEVHAEYVPAPEPSDAPTEPGGPEDELISLALKEFTEESAPSVRQLRARYGIGQVRAQRIRDELAARS
ncbi:hypothetical protein ACIQVR_21685 [Streptomyces xanthochromogenes]|uniref:hypothetical protein n=1 Tax=Streptomyces xanthochromogenes TaxID=67384 RepID=UPI00380B319C